MNSTNNSGNESGKTTVEHFAFIINVVVDGTLCLLGFVGNILVVIVFNKSRTKTSNSVLLQALAVADTCFLTYVLIYVVLRSVGPYTGTLSQLTDAQPYIITAVLPFGWTSQTMTIWMTMIVAVDRCVVVSFPLRSKLWCTPRRALYTSLCVAISAVLFNAARWPRYYFLAFRSDTGSNNTFVAHLSANLSGWNENIYRNVYHISLTFIFLFIVPITTIAIVNIRLIFILRQATKKRLQMTNTTSNAQEQHTNVTRMMVIIISIFIICQLPDFVASIIGARAFQISPVAYAYFAAVKEMLLVFNSAVNFYAYFTFYRSFRRTVKRLLPCFNDTDQNKTNSSQHLSVSSIEHSTPHKVYVSTECVVTKL